MYYVYILRSKINGKLYIGFTNDLKKRYTIHNKRMVKSTKNSAPWELIYYEAFREQESARLREKRLKYFGKSYTELKHRIGL